MSDATREKIRSLTRKSNGLAIACLPVMLWQAWRLGQAVLRVHEATDTAGHVDGPRPVLRVLLIGESTSTGVGANNNDQGLAGHLARSLARLLDRQVHWRVIGLNGYTAQQTRQKLCPQVAQDAADLVIIVHGFNDTVGWTSASKWQREIRHIITELSNRLPHADFILTGIPPFRYFRALPEPTRSILALRADALQLASDEVASSLSRLEHIHLEALPASEYYCVDGFHPSALGYQYWGERLAEELAPGLNPTQAS